MDRMIKQALVGPDGKLRFFWRAVIFYSLGNWGLYPLMERPLARAAQALHFSLGLAPGYTMLHDLWNLAVGLICTGIFAVYEHRRVDSYGLPVKRAFSSHTFKGVATSGTALAISALAWLAANILIGIAEEFWWRHYLQQTLWKSIGFWPASLVIALVFTADPYFYQQGENVWDVITLVSLSLLMSYSILRTGTLWFAVGFHMAFDYMQLFVIGTPNGSQLPEGRLLDASFNGPPWLTGGVLGTEASFLMYPVIALMWLYVWWRYRENPLLQPQ